MILLVTSGGEITGWLERVNLFIQFTCTVYLDSFGAPIGDRTDEIPLGLYILEGGRGA